MAAVKMKSDGTIVLPKEATRTLDPKKRYEAIPMGHGLMIAPSSDVSVKEFFEKMHDGTPAPSEDQIQEWIEDSRKRRRK